MTVLSRVSRVVATAAISVALIGGAAVAPATANPAEEAVYLSALKREWRGTSNAKQSLTCTAYKVAPEMLITKSVEGIRESDAARRALSKAAWTRVISRYLGWACSGPGTTPR